MVLAVNLNRDVREDLPQKALYLWQQEHLQIFGKLD
jgi:hypothetical protein